MKKVAFGLALAGIVLTVALRVVNPWFVDMPLAWFGAVGLGPLLVLRSRRWAAGLLAAWALTLAWPSPGLDSVQVLVVGLDGETFASVDPLVAAGKLPRLGALLGESASAVLVARPPLHSPELWSTIAAGRRDHGVDGFRMRATDLVVPRFWDYALDRGWRVGVYKWLVTTPVRQVDGFMVPGWEARTTDAWPPELGFVKEAELARRVRPRRGEAAKPIGPELGVTAVLHGARMSTLVGAAGWLVRGWASPPTALDRLSSEQRIRAALDRDVFTWACWTYRPALATFGYFAIDGLSHRAAHLHDPALGLDPVSLAYEDADALVGELVDSLPESASVVIFSDHGSAPLRADAARAYLAPLTERLQARITAEVGPVEVARTGGRLTVFPRAETDPARLLAWLRDLHDADAQPVFDADPLPADAGVGLAFHRRALSAADIAAGTVGGEPLADYVRLADDYTGDHDPAGLFILRAPGVAGGQRRGALEQEDVAPTVLALLGVPRPAGLQGASWLVPEVPPDGRPPPDVGAFVYGPSAEPDDDALRALGYVE